MLAQAEPNVWQGRVDAEEGPLGLRWHQTVRRIDASTPLANTVALAGFACDAGVARNHGRTGAQAGPAAIRKMLANLPARAGRVVVDAGDVTCQGDALEDAQSELSGVLHDLLDRGAFPIALGGGHEIAWASFGGLARHLAGQSKSNASAPRIGILNLDAHFDLRAGERGSSGTPFRQIAEDCERRGWSFNYACLGVSTYANTEALFARARQLGVCWLHDDEMDILRLAHVLQTVEAFLNDVDHVYLTMCLDVLPASIAPGVSAPSARGVAMEVIESIVDCVAASGKLRLADVAELNPSLDIDNHTARVAARLVARVADGIAQQGAAHG
ncbi:formimidoylglutamase [Ralstonia sp. UBA689]|uniref:formimidoylglutamase n=1 Tax=Ralstonia sp. UBA689 TaxID=1947373 RepID=UPI0025D71C65|nr:formimidoylglutamase [Ralstonia sp. UBA689]